jgi:squalene cyclase
MSVKVPQGFQTIIHFSTLIIWSLLNSCMKTKQNQLSHKQFSINQRSNNDTQKTNEWIKTLGLNEDAFSNTNIKLLQAQQQASTILNQHNHLLTTTQRNNLEKFQNLMSNKHTRKRLKPTAAHSVLNISTKINRQLFKQNRALDKQSIT